jgi:hypothetical protein
VALLARREPERKAQIREVVHGELAPLAEHVDVAQVEEQLVARLLGRGRVSLLRPEARWPCLAK